MIPNFAYLYLQALRIKAFRKNVKRRSIFAVAIPSYKTRLGGGFYTLSARLFEQLMRDYRRGYKTNRSVRIKIVTI